MRLSRVTAARQTHDLLPRGLVWSGPGEATPDLLCRLPLMLELLGGGWPGAVCYSATRPKEVYGRIHLAHMRSPSDTAAPAGLSPGTAPTCSIAGQARQVLVWIDRRSAYPRFLDVI